MRDTPLPAQPTHSDEVIKSSRHVLAPVERASEILFGLIMVLTLTNSLDVAQAGREGVRTMRANKERQTASVQIPGLDATQKRVITVFLKRLPNTGIRALIPTVR